MKPVREISRAEICALVQSHLDERGINVVLSGGSCVSIYSGEKYVSRNLDLVNIYSVKRRSIRESMSEIGFYEEGRYYKHPESQFLIEFPPGPLSVGVEPLKQIVPETQSLSIYADGGQF